MAVGCQLTVTADVLVTFPNQILARNRTANPIFLEPEPLEDSIKEALPIVLEEGEIKVQYVVELGIEFLVVRVD